MTQADLARRVGIEIDELQRIEGERSPPDAWRLLKIAEALEVPAGDLVARVDGNGDVHGRCRPLTASEAAALVRSLYALPADERRGVRDLGCIFEELRGAGRVSRLPA